MQISQDSGRVHWRDVLPIHPAADLFPLMSETDPAGLKKIGEDIKKRGLIVPIDLSCEKPPRLVDGRNRLDAMALVGLQVVRDGELNHELVHCSTLGPDIDPYEHVISANIRRRHLTSKQKRDLIAKVLKAAPEKSDREIARQVKDDHKKVGRVRSTLEATGAVPQLGRTVGKDGKARKRSIKEKRRTADDFKRGLAAKKADVAKPVPDKTVSRDPVAPNEAVVILKEFATFVLFTAKSVSVDSEDHDRWKTLRGRVKAMLGSAS